MNVLNNIEHRLIKPWVPKTKEMDEKVNNAIKQGTIKQNDYENKELKVKMPFDTIEKWFKIKTKIFNQKSNEF